MTKAMGKTSDKKIPRLPIAKLVGSRFFVAVLCLVAINIFAFKLLGPSRAKEDRDQQIATVLKNAKNRTFSWWTARAYEDELATPDIAIIGSSQMASATFAADAQMLQRTIDVLKHRHNLTFEKALQERLKGNYSVFNCAQGGFMASDAYMLSRALFGGTHKPKVVVIGVSPRDFMDNSLDAASTTEPFQFYAPCVELGKLADRSFADPLSHLQWQLANDLPLRRLKPVEPRQADRKQDDSSPSDGQYRQAAVVQALSDISGDLKAGLLLIPANIPQGLVDNTQEYEHRYHNPYPPVYKDELKFFNELLSFLKRSGIRTIIVGMPALWPTREILPPQFWQDFREHIAAACGKHATSWIDLTDASKFEVDDFLDTVHLNAQGGSRLFSLLADAIARDKDVVASLNQPGDRTKAIAGLKLPASPHQ